MPIIIPESLPASTTLKEENIFVMNESRALHQDIRPLQIAIVNLMPTKVATETQLLRLIGNTPLQVEVILVQTESYQPQNISEDHLFRFYSTFDAIKEQELDGIIITGAPVEQMPFDEVAYWEELKEILDYAKHQVTSSLFICWGAQAALYHYYGVEKQLLDAKAFGVFEHTIMQEKLKLLRGFDDRCHIPHSRHTSIKKDDVAAIDNLHILAESPEVGVGILMSRDERQIFVTGHLEYDPLTLDGEYRRDLEKGLEIQPPAHYYPDDDPSKEPVVRWRAHANLLFSNWLNYHVYQETPYELKKKTGASL